MQGIFVSYEFKVGSYKLEKGLGNSSDQSTVGSRQSTVGSSGMISNIF